MTTLRKKVASALSFAHLTGFAKAETSDDEDKKNKSKNNDSSDQDREDGDSKKGKKAKNAKDDPDDDRDEDEDGKDGDELDETDQDDEDKKSKKSKRAKAEDEDDEADEDDPDHEMRGKSASASARRRERARCAAIFGSKAAGKNPALAANLAFNTRMTRKEAIGVLENSPAAASNVYSDRTARNPGIGAGGAIQTSSRASTSSNWDKVIAKVAPRR